MRKLHGKSDDYLIIGQVTKPSGIKGEVKVFPITDDPGRYHSLSAVYLRSSGSYRKVLVDSARVTGRKVWVKLSSFDSVEEAERLRGEFLYVARKDAVTLARGSHYYYDILGCTVETLDGAVIGKVYDIQNTGSCDVYCVQSADEGKREHLIPAVKDVVKKIVVGQKRIVIDAIEGLLD
jgi:16S rRNA processing protein RimM